MNLKKTIRKTGKWGALALAALLLVVSIFFGLAQTGPGRRQLARIVARAMTPDGETRIQIGKLSGLIPFNFHLDRFILGDARGPWMAAEDLTVHWSPFSLMKGRIFIREFSVQRINLNRAPELKTETDRLSKRKLPSWPATFPRLRIDRFFIHQFALAEAMVGQAAVFKIEAKVRAGTPAGLQETWILVERLDGPKMVLQFHAMLYDEGALLSLDATLAEAQDGLIAATLGSAGPLALSLRGKGPVRDWKGTFRADFPPVGQCESRIQLDMGKPFTIRAQGNLAFTAGFLSKPVAAWFGSRMQFSLLGRFPKSKVLDMERIVVRTGDLALDLVGSLDLKKTHSKGRFTLRCNDLNSLSTLMKVPSSGSFSVEGSFSGPLLQPKAEIHLRTWGCKCHKLSFSRLDGKFLLQFLEPLTGAFPKVGLRGEGIVKGLTLGGITLPLQKEIQWQLETDNPTSDIFHIKKGTVKAEGIRAAFTGRVNPWTTQGEVHALLDVAETSVLADVFGLKLPETGRTSLDTSLRGNMRKSFLASRFRGTSTILDKRLRPILGKEIEYSGHTYLETGKQVMLSEFIAEALPGTFTAKGAYDLGGKMVNASWTLSVPRLLALSPILKRPIEGSVEMQGTLEGPLSEIRLSVQATADNFFIDRVGFGETTVTLSVRGFPPKSEGRLDLEVRPKDQPIHLRAFYALQGDTLTLSSILLDGTKAKLNGTATLDVSKMFFEGELKGRNDDLSVLAALFREEIQGSADGTVRFEIGKSDQQVTLQLEGQDLKTPEVEAEHAGVQAHIQNLFKSAKGSASIEIKNARVQEFALASSRLTADGGLNQFSFALTTRGRHKEHFDLEGSGLFASSPRGQTITLNHLKARYGNLPLQLAGPFQILRSRTHFAVEPFTLRAGSGVLDGKGQLQRNAVALELAFRNMSLNAFRYFGFTSVGGTAGGALTLQGSPQHPAGFLRLRVDNLKMDDPQFADFPAGILEIEAQLEHQRIRGEASLQRLTDQPFKATFDVPVNLALRPFAFFLRQEEEMTGHVVGTVDLARIVALLGLDDQKMTGRMDLDLALGGRAKNPEINGKAIVHDGTYENLRSGTILKDMDVEIAASMPQLKIERARATDGEKGIITANGWFDILPSQRFPFKVGLTLEHAKPFRHDRASATAGGQLTLEGSLAKSALKGKLLIESAEFRIPERLPPVMTNLEVVEINRQGEVIKPSQDSRLLKRGVFKLDLSVLSPGRAFVRGRGLDSEWQGEMKITGTASEPIITGKLGIVRGRFNFLGKQFDLTRGLISFQGETPPSPLLDVRGEARTKDITARIELSGSLQSPEITLSSEPSLPTDEILSRLLFGRSVTQITPLQALQLANAVNRLAGGRGIDYMGRTREVLKLDQLEIKQSGSKPEDTAVSAGKYVSDTVFLEVEQGLGPDSGKASVQWEMTPNITVETEAGVNAEVGAGVSWKWDY